MEPSLDSIIELVDENGRDDDSDYQIGTLSACLDSLWTHVPQSDQQKAFDALWAIVGDRLGMDDDEMKETLGIEAEESQEEVQEVAQEPTVDGICWSNVNVGEILLTNYPNDNHGLYPVAVKEVSFNTTSQSGILVSVNCYGHDRWLDAGWFKRQP